MAPSRRNIILFSFFVYAMAFSLQAGCSTAARPQPPANLHQKVAAKQAPPPATQAKAAHKQAPSPAIHTKAAHKQAPSPAAHPKAVYKQAPSPAIHPKAAQKQAPLPATHLKGAHKQAPSPAHGHLTKSTVNAPSPAQKLTALPPTAAATGRIPDMRDLIAYDVYMQTVIHCYVPPFSKCPRPLNYEDNF